MTRYDSPSVDEHHDRAHGSVACGVVTVSDTRTLADDRSGAAIVEMLEAAGHRALARAIVPDEPAILEATVRNLVGGGEVEAILLTGGTGIAPRDRTPETIQRLLTTELSGYGELFRMLSYQEIGAAALMSRALGGLIESTVVLLMPGSTPAVRLAMDKLILPELGHLVALARR